MTKLNWEQVLDSWDTDNLDDMFTALYHARRDNVSLEDIMIHISLLLVCRYSEQLGLYDLDDFMGDSDFADSDD